jgi:hypothetical protein
MKYIIKNRETCNYLIDKESKLETDNIHKAFYIISEEDCDYLETFLTLNTIFPFYYKICLYERELIMIRKNKLKKLNYFL